MDADDPKVEGDARLRAECRKAVVVRLVVALGERRGLDEIDEKLPPPQRLERAVEANVRWSMRQLRETPEGRARMAEGRMKLVGAVCDIANGRVRLLA